MKFLNMALTCVWSGFANLASIELNLSILVGFARIWLDLPEHRT
jgi:hypothetical protein